MLRRVLEFRSERVLQAPITVNVRGLLAVRSIAFVDSVSEAPARSVVASFAGFVHDIDEQGPVGNDVRIGIHFEYSEYVGDGLYEPPDYVQDESSESSQSNGESHQCGREDHDSTYNGGTVCEGVQLDGRTQDVDVGNGFEGTVHGAGEEGWSESGALSSGSGLDVFEGQSEQLPRESHVHRGGTTNGRLDESPDLVNESQSNIEGVFVRLSAMSGDCAVDLEQGQSGGIREGIPSLSTDSLNSETDTTGDENNYCAPQEIKPPAWAVSVIPSDMYVIREPGYIDTSTPDVLMAFEWMKDRGPQAVLVRQSDDVVLAYKMKKRIKPLRFPKR